jgi:antitoxin VapB
MPIPDPAPIHVHLFRSKSQQAVEIPLGFELPGDEAIISRDGDRLIIEPVRRKGIAALLVSWGHWTKSLRISRPIRRMSSLRRPDDFGSGAPVPPARQLGDDAV